MRTRILSDLHLGHSASRIKDVQMLAPLLEEIDQLVLAGDIWQQRTSGDRYDRAHKMFDELLEMIHERGIEVIVLRGNHDPDSGEGLTWLVDRQVLVIHGDAVYDDATPWSREISHYRKEVDAVVEKYRSQGHLAQACADRATEIAKTIKPRPLPKLPVPFNFFATALWPLSRTFEMIRVWQGMGKQGLKFLHHSGEGAKVLVCGHFHQAGVWDDEGSLMINTGSFMRGSKPWFVDVNGVKLTAREVELDDEEFVYGKVKGRFLVR